MNVTRHHLGLAGLSVLAALLLAALLPFSVPEVKSAGGTFGGGTGVLGDPYLIEDIDDLQAMNNNLTAYYKLANDIDASATSGWDSGAGFVPIAGGGTANLFTGNFDGDYHTITGLTINRPTTLNVGLFGHVGQGGIIRNVKLVNTTVTGQRGVGTLIGRVTGSVDTLIEQCSSSGGTVTGNGATGGLIGSHNSVTETAGGTNNPIASYCFADVAVVYSAFSLAGTDDKGDKFGGLAGCSQKGTITNSFARGSVSHQGGSPTEPERIAGLAGCIAFRGNVVNSYSTGLVTVDGDRIRVGGLVGYLGTGGNAGKVTNSFWDTETSGQATSAGTGATGKTTVQMKTEATFTAAGWDFTGIWSIDATEAKNNGYPYLQWYDAAITAFSNTPSYLTFGIVVEGETYDHGLDHFTITNSGGTAIDISIKATDMTGIGSDWVLSATATPDTNVFGLKAGLEGGSFNIIVTTVATTLKSTLAAGDTQKWGLQFLAPTTFTDGGQKTGTIILTIVGS